MGKRIRSRAASARSWWSQRQPRLRAVSDACVVRVGSDPCPTCTRAWLRRAKCSRSLRSSLEDSLRLSLLPSLMICLLIYTCVPSIPNSATIDQPMIGREGERLLEGMKILCTQSKLRGHATLIDLTIAPGRTTTLLCLLVRRMVSPADQDKLLSK